MRIDPKEKKHPNKDKQGGVEAIMRKIAIAMVFCIIYFFAIKLLFL